MDLTSIMELRPTASEEESMTLWADILIHQPDWRCYSSAVVEDVRSLAQRFLHLHALTPGWISPTIIAHQPMAVIRGRGQGYEMWGAVFTNGAIVQLKSLVSKETNLLLFVEERTAHGWKYPEVGWMYTPSLFAATPRA